VAVIDNIDVTKASWDLFMALLDDAGNWSGMPLVEVTPEERGNLTQLKRAGLLTTFTDQGDSFATFTDKGKAVAAELGYDTEVLY